MSDILERLADVVESRKAGDPEKSYVSRLFARGPDAILKKVGEEATEAVMAAKDGDRLRIVGETADLWFHCLIMLAQYGLRPPTCSPNCAAARAFPGSTKRPRAPTSGARSLSGNRDGRGKLRFLQDRPGRNPQPKNLRGRRLFSPSMISIRSPRCIS